MMGKSDILENQNNMENQDNMEKNDMIEKRTVIVDGIMTFGKLENGLHTADFQNYETEVEIEPFYGRCKVQVMRDGNAYITELPKQVRHKPLFRQDDSSLSLGRNGVYYFVFRLPEAEAAKLPEKLVRQANEAAAKMSGMFYHNDR